MLDAGYWADFGGLFGEWGGIFSKILFSKYKYFA
jgi:hypothetical protein